jgi:hypothetical protein
MTDIKRATIQSLHKLIEHIEQCDDVGHCYIDMSKEDVPIFIWTDYKDVKSFLPESNIMVKVEIEYK